MLYLDYLVGKHDPHHAYWICHHNLDPKCICTMIAFTFGLMSLLFRHPLYVLPQVNSHSERSLNDLNQQSSKESYFAGITYGQRAILIYMKYFY